MSDTPDPAVTETSAETPDETTGDEKSPSIVQLVHWATGDRDAEAKELAAQSDSVSEDEALVAVKRAHGDVPSDRGIDESQVATVSDAREVGDEDG